MQALPDKQVCEQARLSRDPRFDGLFFTAVTSTRIYCRPVCPVPTVKSANVVYYGNAAAAEAAGYRPCLRCRPELSPGAWSRGDSLVERALKLIDEGFLADQPLAALADRLGVGERQLRRLFMDRLGASPLDVHLTRRLLFAKQLLTETDLSITSVALEAGFGSLRRFNASFRKAYRLAPSELRRSARHGDGDALVLRLGYRPPFDFAALLEALRQHAVPGIATVDEHAYSHTFGSADFPGWFRISAWPGQQHAVRLQLHCPQVSHILDIVRRVRRMFDLDADPEIIDSALARDSRLRPLLESQPGLRLSGGWDGFEVAILAVLEQTVGAETAPVVASHLIRHCGHELDTPFAPGLERLFPTPEAVANTGLARITLPSSCARMVHDVARMLLDGALDFNPERTLDEFVTRWSAVPGIDRVTVHRIAMRALGHPDAFPLDTAFSHPELDIQSCLARWRPWCAYAAMHLLRNAGTFPARHRQQVHTMADAFPFERRKS